MQLFASFVRLTNITFKENNYDTINNPNRVKQGKIKENKVKLNS